MISSAGFRELTSPFRQDAAASLSCIKINSTPQRLPPPSARSSLGSKQDPLLRSAAHSVGRHPSQNNLALPRSKVEQPTFVLELQITGKPKDHEDLGENRSYRTERKKKKCHKWKRRTGRNGTASPGLAATPPCLQCLHQ